MKFIKPIFLVLAATSVLGGCKIFGDQVEVPTAHRGIISTSAGLEERILPPSKMRLEGFCYACDSLIVAEVSDYPILEEMELFMPKDRLNINFEVRGTFATSDNDEQLKTIFSRVPPRPHGERVSLISSEHVFDTYARQIVRDRVRAVVSEYDIQTLMDNREAVGARLAEAVRDGLKNRPVEMLNFGFDNIQPPEVVLKAELTRKTREIEILQADAEKEVALRRAGAALEVAAVQQTVDLKEAETQVLIEQKLREGFSEAYVAQRGLKILDRLAASDNNVIFLPTEALTNPSVMIGSVQKALNPQAPEAPIVLAPEAPVSQDQ